jgi:transcriptional regulator with GAF, ATPase, and Fis domain
VNRVTIYSQAEAGMRAELEAIAGPLKGSVLALSDELTSIGREPGNAISLIDPAVSRHHCTIERDGDGFKLTDLKSRNNTFVNGVPVDARVLQTGDQIKIGASLFRFLYGSEEDTSTSLEMRDEPAGASTVVLRKEDALYLKMGRAPDRLPATTRTVRDLNALLRISRAIGSVRELEPLVRQLLESIFEVMPADRAAILLTEGGEFTSVFGWDRRTGSTQPVEASRTIVNQVLAEGVAVLNNDPAGETGFPESASVMLRRISSVLAAPLEVFDRVIGVIYLDSSDPEARFDEGHLQLLSAIGGAAAIALDNAKRLMWLEGENQRLQAEINVEHNMVGDGPRMREVYQFIQRVSGSDATVLIYGESGTGKELVARAIHRNGARAGKPYMAINCAAITETLLESELFGHEKGAFTGATGQKKGKLEAAEGGTVFLDEIGELAPLLQAKLLRVLQEREFERVGGTRTIKLNVRIVAATNRDLDAEVRAGRFRQDLYYRLNVVSICMPPLRERRDDISALASYFAAKYGETAKRKIAGISPEARSCLMRYDWPGNVRELENAIERAVVLGSSELILVEDLPETLLENASPSGETAIGSFHDGVREAKKRLIQNALDEAGGNYTDAARLLGLHPNYLHRLIRNLKLRKEA